MTRRMRRNARVWTKNEAIQVEMEEAATGGWTALAKTEKEATLLAKDEELAALTLSTDVRLRLRPVQAPGDVAATASRGSGWHRLMAIGAVD